MNGGAGVSQQQSKSWPSGSVKRIVFNNFLTYGENVEFNAGPNLNLIIGTNGSGKSSIICAMCLAMGGRPSLLGRSERLQDYVKHGRQSATVEITLNLTEPAENTNGRGTERTAKILCRIYKRDTNQIEFFINGEKSNAKKVREFVSRYSIQIENPCTFLAQDKVKSFSAQSPQLLLENTEKAACEELWETHQTLRDMKTEGERLQKTVRRLEGRIGEIKAQLAVLDPLVQIFRERQTIKHNIALTRKKLSFQMYEETRKVYAQVRNEQKEKSAQVKAAMKALEPFNAQIDKLKEELKSLGEQLRVQRRNMSTSKGQIEILEDKLHQYRGQKETIRRQFERVEREAGEYEQKVTELENQIEAAEQQLQQLKSRSHNEIEQIRVLREERKKLRDEQESVERKVRHNEQQASMFANQIRTLKESLSGWESEQLKKVETLGHLGRNSGVADAWRFYAQNRQQFRAPVYVPLVSMATKDEQSCKYLENLVGQRDMQMFICQSADDEKRLHDEANRQNWRINTTVVAGNSLQGLEKPAQNDSFKSMQFHCFAVDLCEIPPVVKQYLCRIYRLHEIPIGSQQTDRLLDAGKIDDRVKKQFPLFLTPTKRVQSMKSKYTGKFTTRMDDLRAANWLRATVSRNQANGQQNHAETQRKVCELEEKHGQMEKQKQPLQDERQRLATADEKYRQKLRHLTEQAQARDSCGRELERKKSRLESLKSHKPDVPAARRKMCGDLLKNEKSAIDTAKTIRQNLRSMAGNLTALTQNGLKHAQASERLEAKLQQIENLRTELRQKEEELGAIEDRLDELRNEMRERKGMIRELTGFQEVNQNAMDAQDRARFDRLFLEFERAKLPDSVERLRNRIAQENGRLEAMLEQGSEQDLVNFERLEAEKQENETQLVTDRRKLDTWREGMGGRLTEWVENVKELIAGINANYSKFFEKLDCAGEVSLHTPTDPTEMSEYGVEIGVKFRAAEKLRRLTAQVQSGGERSVSTMCYLMALQELSPVPFRCVDEINQGMDANNERKVVEMVVEMLEREQNLSKTQYFMLTPKLLTNLNLSAKVTAQVVFNGPAVHTNAPDKRVRWSEDKYMERCERRSQRGAFGLVRV